MPEMPKKIKLSPAMKRELKILIECGSISTYGSGVRFNLLMRMVQNGTVRQGEHGHHNMFRLTELGKWSAVLGGIGVNMKISHWMALPNKPYNL